MRRKPYWMYGLFAALLSVQFFCCFQRAQIAGMPETGREEQAGEGQELKTTREGQEYLQASSRKEAFQGKKEKRGFGASKESALIPSIEKGNRQAKTFRAKTKEKTKGQEQAEKTDGLRGPPQEEKKAGF